MEVISMPVISTSHLDEDTAARLAAEGDGNPWCQCAEYEYGYYLCVSTLRQPDVPQCLIDIAEWLATAGPVGDSRWVRLESMAAAVPGLPLYDW